MEPSEEGRVDAGKEPKSLSNVPVMFYFLSLNCFEQMESKVNLMLFSHLKHKIYRKECVPILYLNHLLNECHI